MEFELLGQVAPFLRIVGEDTSQDANGNGERFGNNLFN